MKAVIVILLLMIVGFMGYNFNEQRIAKEHQRILQAEREKEQSIQNIINDLRAATRKRIEQAILDHRVIEGMSRYEVKQTWGRPDDIVPTARISAEDRNEGIAEKWIYPSLGEPANGTVYFDLNDKVMYVVKYKQP